MYQPRHSTLEHYVHPRKPDDFDHPLEAIRYLAEGQPTEPQFPFLTQDRASNGPPFQLDLRSIYRHPITGIQYNQEYAESASSDTIDFLTKTLFLGELESSVSTRRLQKFESNHDPYILSYAPFYLVEHKLSDYLDTELRALPILRPNLPERFFSERLGKISPPRVLPSVYLALWVSRESETDKRTPGWRRALRKSRTKFLLRPFTPEDQAGRLAEVEQRRMKRELYKESKGLTAAQVSALLREQYNVLPTSPEADEALSTLLRSNMKKRNRLPYLGLRNITESFEEGSTEPAPTFARSCAIVNPLDPTLDPLDLPEEAALSAYEMLFEPRIVSVFNYQAGKQPTAMSDAEFAQKRRIFMKSASISPLPRPSGEDTEQGFIGFIKLPREAEPYFARFSKECVSTNADRPTKRQFKRDTRPPEEQNGRRPEYTYAHVAPSGLIRVYPSSAHLNHIVPPNATPLENALSVRTLPSSTPTEVFLELFIDENRSPKFADNRLWGATTLSKAHDDRLPPGIYTLCETPVLGIHPKKNLPSLTILLAASHVDRPPTTPDGLVLVDD